MATSERCASPAFHPRVLIAQTGLGAELRNGSFFHQVLEGLFKRQNTCRFGFFPR